jgi:sulfur carrier protein
VTVTVNGAVMEVEVGTTVAAIVETHATGRRHVAVARNGAVVPRGAWSATCVQSGDVIEVLAPVTGG